jgi:mannose-6-phosphate isomerase-like protein (cupin superfamily)
VELGKIASGRICRENAPHYIGGDDCEEGHLLQESDLSVIEELMPPGTSDVRHFHKNAQQFFFLLSGRATMEANGEPILFLAGQGVAIPPGTRHLLQSLHRARPLRGDLTAAKSQ